MPSIKYLIELSDEDRKKLEGIVKKGTSPARTIMRANILLASDRNGKKPMTVDEVSIAFMFQILRFKKYALNMLNMVLRPVLREKNALRHLCLRM